MARRLKVAVLTMDDLNNVDVDEQLRSYLKLYVAWFEKVGGLAADFVSFDVHTRREFPTDTNEYDLYMLTGSKASVYDVLADLDWIASAIEFVRRLDNEGRRILGICFGHQLVAQSFDGKVMKNPNGWEVGWASFELTPDARALLGVSNEPRVSIDLLYTHQDAVVELPPGFINLGGNANTRVQGMAKGGNIITFQGHPEFPREVVNAIISGCENRWSSDFVHEARQSLANATNEALVLTKALEYLGLLQQNSS